MSNVRVLTEVKRIAAPNEVLNNGATVVLIAWNPKFPNEGQVLAVRTDAHEPYVVWNAWREHLDASSAEVMCTSGRYFGDLNAAYVNYVKRLPAA